MKPKISVSLRQYSVRHGKHGIEVVPLDSHGVEIEEDVVDPKILAMGRKAALGHAKMKRIAATCKHDEGAYIHQGEEVCSRCHICPIPRQDER